MPVSEECARVTMFVLWHEAFEGDATTVFGRLSMTKDCTTSQVSSFHAFVVRCFVSLSHYTPVPPPSPHDQSCCRRGWCECFDSRRVCPSLPLRNNMLQY